MLTLQEHVLSILSRLAEIEPKKNVKEAQELLRATLLAEDADFGVHGRNLLANILEDSFSLELRFRIDFDGKTNLNIPLERRAKTLDAGQVKLPSGPGDSASSPPPSGTETGPSSGPEAHLSRAIQGLDRQERRRDFVWIGYIAQTLLPSLGLDAHESQEMLDDMLSKGIVASSKVPNPNNPEFPTTRVQLNREHPLVKRILENDRPTGFRPIKISGPPISEDIIRDRR